MDSPEGIRVNLLIFLLLTEGKTGKKQCLNKYMDGIKIPGKL
jgi:hypothetical protein